VLGHRDIAFVGAPESSTPGAERLAGYRSALSAADVRADPDLVLPGAFTYEDGLAAVDLLRRDRRPTAVFAASDAVALGVLEAARRVHLRVPDDLSVVGFDDSYAALDASPQLTTVRQPLTEMGRLAMRSTVGAVRGRPQITSHIQLATTLVERGSTARVTA
jgi:LacI family transcriptional regulator